MGHALFLNWDHTFLFLVKKKNSRFYWKGSTAVEQFGAWFVTWHHIYIVYPLWQETLYPQLMQDVWSSASPSKTVSYRIC